ncbi:MAG: M1 family metallopeptidase [Acidobacteriota bacterium]
MKLKNYSIKVLCLLFVSILISYPCLLNSSPLKPITEYKIKARLFPEKKEIEGLEILTWFNNSGDEVKDLWFHLYLNAFKNEKSTFFKESSLLKHEREISPNQNGWTEIKSLKIVDGDDLTNKIKFISPDDGNPEDMTVFKVELNKPILPYSSIQLEIKFISKLPKIIARAGFYEDFFMVSQWFPKIGVWEEKGFRGRKESGWNCHQYHRNSEFYSDFGDYTVQITIPKNYKLAASGKKIGEFEESENTRTFIFSEKYIHDFAWACSPEFIEIKENFNPKKDLSKKDIIETKEKFQFVESLNPVKILLYLLPEHIPMKQRYITSIKNSLKYLGLWYGRYPYEFITAVDAPIKSKAGGMEYPTLVTVETQWSHPEKMLSPEGVTIHELGHQYWYGIVANNEFEEAWLDEGINTYSTTKILDKVYGDQYSYMLIEGIPLRGLNILGLTPFFGSFYEDFKISGFLRNKSGYLVSPDKDPVIKNSWEFLDNFSYRANSYRKSALVLLMMENIYGERYVMKFIKNYYKKYRFKHPCSEDFIRMAEESIGNNARKYLELLLNTTGVLDYGVKEAISSTFYSYVIVERKGEIPIPVDILFKFEDGSSTVKKWDGMEKWKKFEFYKKSSLSEIIIDPEKKLIIDINSINNSLKLKGKKLSFNKFLIRFIFWIQNFLHSLIFLV